METAQTDHIAAGLIQVSRDRLAVFAAGMVLMGLPCLLFPNLVFLTALTSLMAILCIRHAVGSGDDAEPYQIIQGILFFGAIQVFLESVRMVIPSGFVRHSIALFFSIPVATASALLCYRLLTISKTKKIKGLFLFMMFLVFVMRSPAFPLFTGMTVLAALPCRWVPALKAAQLRKIIIIGLALLSGWIALFSLHREPLLETAQYNFLAAGMFSLGSTMFRVFVYCSVLCGLWRIFKPMRIRTRLRWAFLLNFLVPFSLLLMLSGFAVVFLVGGYNAAVAQRIIGQYGVDAAHRARTIFMSFSGTRPELSENVPFAQVVMIRLPDGTEAVTGPISDEITKWLNHDRHRQVEFISVERDGNWEFWVAGYYHHGDQSGAVMAYRVDDIMLNKVRDATGFEVMLIRGQSIPWISSAPDNVPFYRSDGMERIKNDNRLFNIGAGMFYNPADGQDVSLSATLRILGTREMLLNALMMSRIKTADRDDPVASKQLRTSFGLVTADTFDLETINVFNLFLFILLAGMFGVLLALVILSLSTSFLISRRINRSVKVLKDGTTALESGNLDYRIPIVSADELGELARDFNQMAGNLGKYTAVREKLLLEQVEKERLQETFETARLLQQSLLPEGSIDNHPALEVAADFRPMDTVGGDYYDYLWFRDNGLGLVIGDVSGHGMPAGLMMAMAKSCLVNQVRTSPGIQDVMSAVNNMIHDSFQSKRIMTFQYAVFTPDGSRMRFASAGHQFPYLYRVADESLHELESIAYPLGVRHTLSLDTKEITLEPGDAVIMYTDGLVEAVNSNEEQLGYDRLQDIFREVSHLSAQDAVTRVMHRIDSFRDGARQVDDITLVIVRRRVTALTDMEEPV